jgi:hypothetical protein
MSGNAESISPSRARPAPAPRDNRRAECHLDVQFVAATRARAPNLCGDHTLRIKGLHLQLPTSKKFKGPLSPCLICSVLIADCCAGRADGIIHLPNPSVTMSFRCDDNRPPTLQRALAAIVPDRMQSVRE